MTHSRALFVFLLVALPLLVIVAPDAAAQRIDGEDFLSPERLQTEWLRVQRSAEGKRLYGEAKRRGLRIVTPRESGWGWTASVISETAGREPVLFCLFELQGRNGRPAGALLRLQRGARESLALLLLEAGAPTDAAEEWEIDKAGRPTRITGWSSRFLREMHQWCGTACTGALRPCGADGERAGLKAWLSCATSICGNCVLVSMLVSGRL